MILCSLVTYPFLAPLQLLLIRLYLGFVPSLGCLQCSFCLFNFHRLLFRFSPLLFFSRTLSSHSLLLESSLLRFLLSNLSLFFLFGLKILALNLGLELNGSLFPRLIDFLAILEKHSHLLVGPFSFREFAFLELFVFCFTRSAKPLHDSELHSFILLLLLVAHFVRCFLEILGRLRIHLFCPSSRMTFHGRFGLFRLFGRFFDASCLVLPRARNLGVLD